MFRRRLIGGKHTAVENLVKGLPKHIVGQAKETVSDLMKQGFLTVKPTSYGVQVSLNPEIIDEIMNLIEENEEEI